MFWLLGGVFTHFIDYYNTLVTIIDLLAEVTYKTNSNLTNYNSTKSKKEMFMHEN